MTRAQGALYRLELMEWKGKVRREIWGGGGGGGDANQGGDGSTDLKCKTSGFIVDHKV